MSKTIAAFLVAALWPSASVSAAPLPGFVLVGQTEHFAFYSRGDRKFDGRDSERYLRRLETLFGHSVAGRAEYYRCERPEDVASATGLYTSGVTAARDRRVFSIHDFHAHELVHLVAGQIGHAGSFFDEGLAVAVADEAPLRKTDADRVARTRAGRNRVSELAAGFDSLKPDVAYALAGSFVGFLLETHGIARVTEFLRGCGPSGKDHAGAFERAFGQTLDEAGDAWRATLRERRS